VSAALAREREIGARTMGPMGREPGASPTLAAADLFAAQGALQAAAREVLADLDLMTRLTEIGTPTQTGSFALGLMVARDIDVTTVCPSLETDVVFAVMRPIANHPRVRRLTFRNDTGHWNTDPDYPDGLYWMLDYVAESGVAWNLDLWFLLDGTTQFDLEHVKVLPGRLTPETRAAILRIKRSIADWPAAQRIAGYEIYEAVLDHGVRTVEQFMRRRSVR
jgi:hypothetical protein